MTKSIEQEAYEIVHKLYGKTKLTLNERIELYDIYNRAYNRHETDYSCVICQHRIAKNLEILARAYEPTAPEPEIVPPTPSTIIVEDANTSTEDTPTQTPLS